MSTTGQPEPRDPGEYLDDDPPHADQRRAAINALPTGVDWMSERSRRVAHRYDLDADDILQLTWMRLLHSSTVVDLTNNGRTRGVRHLLAPRRRPRGDVHVTCYVRTRR